MLILSVSALNCRLSAFDGYEHAAVSIYGLYWARLIYDQGAKTNTRGRDIDSTINDLLNPVGRKRRVTKNADGTIVIGPEGDDIATRRATYGEMVEVVDFIETPFDCLDGELIFGSNLLRDINEHPQGQDSLYMLKRLDAQNHSRELVISRIHSLLSYLQSSHTNSTHFENRAMAEYVSWHLQALVFADENNLWQALWMEAYADLFLQDFFAPGHIRTPRNQNIVDVVSLAMHDHFNRTGQDFKVFEKSLPLKALQEIREDPLKGNEALVSGPILKGAFLGGKKADKYLAAECLNPGDVAILREGMFAEPHNVVKLFGDDLLKPRSPPRQGYDDMLLVILATTASISDVINTYENAKIPGSKALGLKASSSEASMPGAANPEAAKSETMSPVAVISVAANPVAANPEVAKREAAKLLDRDLFTWESDFETRGLFMQYSQTVDAMLPYGSYTVRTAPVNGNAGWEQLTLDRVYAFEVNYQSLLGADTGSDRIELDAETLVWGYKFPNSKYVTQIGALAGYSYIVGRDSWGQGPMVKIVLPLPQIDLQAYIYGGFRWYYDSQTYSGRPFGGIGAESGYGLYFLRLNLSGPNGGI